MFISNLFNLNRSLLGKDNDIALYIIDSEIPVTIHWIPSGTKCFDWIVPKSWVLKKAILKDSQGNIILDASKNILHVVNYSSSIRCSISREKLDNHLYYDRNCPNSIPYKTSYYDNKWGFCLSYNQYRQLNDENYTVEIESEFINSMMSIGESCIKGRSEREVILTSYICHPLQANDGLSGVQLLIDLYNKLKDRDNYYTYRFFFMPETIGALVLLSQNYILPENVEYGLVATCVGVGEELNYKETFIGNHTLDNIVRYMGIKTRKFKPYGSDERQFSSPNIRIPVGSLTRAPYDRYPQYHTSEDNMDLISQELIEETTDIYYEIIEKYEKDKRYVGKHKGGEPFLSQYDLYRKISTTGHTKWGKIRNWVLFLSDGLNTIDDMAVKSGYTRIEIENCINTMIKRGVVDEINFGTDR